jgi:predicted CXXCH cytochrome family protein
MKSPSIIGIAVVMALAIFAVATCAQTQAMPPVNQKTACLACHSEMSEVLTQPDVHQPLSEGKCSACHNPHASKHAGLLDEKEAKLCAQCHMKSLTWTQEPQVHDPVAKGRCTVCHDPHASKNNSLLKNNMKELCATCHHSVKDWSKRAFLHDPVKRGQCNICHTPHAGTEDNLLKTDQAKLCLSCHRITPMFTASHSGFDPKSAKCSACHDPHSGDSQTLVMKRVHPPFEERDCAACHAKSQNAQGQYPLKSGIQTVCSSCHEDQTAQVRRFSAHGSTETSSCEKCHNGHASHEDGLLLQSQRQLCRKCHAEPAAETSTADFHAKQACTTCHSPHGSAQTSYLIEDDLTLCAKCHNREHHVAHPMGDAAKEKLTGKPVTCISCHKLHGWKADPLLYGDGTRDLCVRCHNK